MRFSVSVFRDEDKIPELIDLFATGLSDTSPAYWKWRLFTQNGVTQPLAFVAYDEDGKMAGMMTVLPQVYGNFSRYGLQNCDWVVHPGYRGKGLNAMMYQAALEYFSSGYDYLIAISPNEFSYPIFMKYGYDDTGYTESWNSTKKLIYFPKQTHDKECRGYSFSFTDACVLEEIPQREDRQYRSPTFMQWKFDQNPDCQYTWLTVRKGTEIIGYFVYTITRGRLRTAVNVCDWDMFADDSFAMKEAVKLLAQRGHYVNIWGKYHSREKALLKSAGLKETVSGIRIVMKAFGGKDYPKDLTMTRIDMDY